VLSIIDETVDEARRRVPGLVSLGLPATTGTAASGVYQRALAARGIACLLPDDDDHAVVMSVIYDQVKAGKPGDVEALRGVANRLVGRGAQVVALGCTKLSVVAEDEGLLGDPLFVDSLDVLARRTIERAGGQVRG
jgi:aspartate racemase